MADPRTGPPPPGPMAPPAPAGRRRGGARRWTWLVVTAGVVVVGVVAGGAVLIQNVRNGYYIGEEGGKVVLYRGTTDKMPVISLSRKASAKQQPNPPILVSDLPQDLQARVRKTYTVKGPGAVDDLKNNVCKYVVTEESGKLVIVKGKGQDNCQQSKLTTSEIPVAELPESDRTAVSGNRFAFIGRPAAETKLRELGERRDECKSSSPTIQGCPSGRGKS